MLNKIQDDAVIILLLVSMRYFIKILIIYLLYPVAFMIYYLCLSHVFPVAAILYDYINFIR